MLRVWKMKGVMHDTLILHDVGVICYMLCVFKMDGCSV